MTDPSGFFSVRLSRAGTDFSETIPASIRLQRVGSPSGDQSYLTRVPFHEVALEDAPGGQECFLQIWDLDFFATNRFLSHDETDLNRNENKLLANVPGVVIKDGGRYRFAATGPADVLAGEDAEKGFVTVELDQAGSSTPEEVKIHLPEYESVVELAGVIAIRDSDRPLERAYNMQPFLVHNVKASILYQVATRGGIAVAFVADYWKNGTIKANDREFERQADNMLPTFPTLKVEGGKIVFGYHMIKHYNQMSAILGAVRDQAKSDGGLSSKPKVALLPIYAHGLPNALKISLAGFHEPGSIQYHYQRNGRGTVYHDIEAPVAQLVDHVTDDVVMPLFACSGARGASPNQDNSMGDHYAAEELGGDSVAWAMLRELIKQGVPNPTIWSHLTAGHTTRNNMLRVLSSVGTADWVNVLYGRRRVDSAAVGAYRRIFWGNSKEVLRRQNMLRTVSLCHAAAFDWTFHGGPKAHVELSAEARADALVLFNEMRNLMPAATTVEDGVVFDGAMTEIQGMASPVAWDAKISENFLYREYTSLMDPEGPLPLKLARMVQLLRYRSRVAIKLHSVSQDSTGRVYAVQVEPVPNTSAKRIKLRDAANEMRDEGILKSAVLVGTTSLEITV